VHAVQLVRWTDKAISQWGELHPIRSDHQAPPSVPEVHLLAILSVTGPIYLLIAVGFLVVRRGLFSQNDLPTLGRYVVHLALPALVFKAVTQQHLGQALRLDYLLIYGLGSGLTLALGYLWCRLALRQSALDSALSIMGMGCSNSGFIGYPILLMILPAVANTAFALNMVVENLVIIPLLLTLAERARHGTGDGWRGLARTLARVARNPMMIGLLLGLLVAASGLTLPLAVSRTIDMLAASCAALSLTLIGGSLVGFAIQAHWRPASPIVIGKLLLHPACVMLVLWVLTHLGLPAVPPGYGAAAVLSAAMPMFGIYPVLAQAYGRGELSSGALLSTTLASFLSLGLIMAGLRQIGWM